MPLIDGEIIAFDTETNGLSPWLGHRPFGFGFQNEHGERVYLEFDVDPFTREVRYNPTDVKGIKEVLTNPKSKKLFWHGMFDVRMVHEAFGFLIAGELVDVMFMAHTCNSLEEDYKLKPMAWRKLGYPQDDEKQLQDLVKKLRNWSRKHHPDWPLGYEYKTNKAGEETKKAAVKADYWLPAAVRALHPGIVTQKEANLCGTYCKGDVTRTFALWEYYCPMLDDLDLWENFNLEMKLFWITYNMEGRGVRIFPQRLKTATQETLKLLKDAQQQLNKLAGRPINIDSKPQLATLLFKDRGLSFGARTKLRTKDWPQGVPVCDVNALKPHREDAAVHQVNKVKAHSKALSTYFFNYRRNLVPDREDPRCLVIHPDFQQVGPVTGRYSCRNPNLQNVANALTTRSEEPIQARTPFGPRPGHAWWLLDYKQLEVVIFASLSGEDFMIDALLRGRDIHTECTNKAWGGENNPAAIRAAIHSLELDGTGEKRSPQVLEAWNSFGLNQRLVSKLDFKDEKRIASEWLSRFAWDIVAAEASLDKHNSRAKAKMILFAKIFGGGPYAIMDLLWCSEDEARQFLADYDVAFPRVVEFIKEESWKARKNRCVYTEFGRRITVDPDKPYRSVNYRVQGSAADLLKRSMIRCADYLQRTGLEVNGYKLVLTIHDELVFECRRPTRTGVIRSLQKIMEDHGGRFVLPTPVTVARVTDRWDIKEKVDI